MIILYICPILIGLLVFDSVCIFARHWLLENASNSGFTYLVIQLIKVSYYKSKLRCIYYNLTTVSTKNEVTPII